MESILQKKIEPRIAGLGALYAGDSDLLFRDCLLSIEAQTIKIPVFIIVDGKICDRLEKIISEFKSLNINYLRMSSNKGLAAALQYGLKELEYEFDYIIRFDADDINLPNRFEKLIKLINELKPDLASSQMNEIDAHGNIFSKRNVPTTPSAIARWMPFRNPINHPASLIKIKSALDVGGYKEMPFFEDWYLWERMSSKGYKIINTSDYLVNFRATDSMISRRFGSDYKKFEASFFRTRIIEGNSNRLLILLAWVIRFAVKSLSFKKYKSIFYWIRR